MTYMAQSTAAPSAHADAPMRRSHRPEPVRGRVLRLLHRQWLACGCLVALLLSGCASAGLYRHDPPGQPNTSTKVRRYRTVQGSPPPQAPNLSMVRGVVHEWGIASFYGEAFHGKPTASGEPFDMHALTAAHKTLPLGTTVRATNLDNGMNVVVRINDRGPFIAGRIIDLSYGAAQAVHMVEAGIANIAIEILEPGEEAER